MQLASVISDLTTLRVCDPAAALALVTAGKVTLPDSGSMRNTSTTEEQDKDLQRAQTLLQLHESVKVAYTPVPSAAGQAYSTRAAQQLQQARNDVNRVIQKLGISSIPPPQNQPTQPAAKAKPSASTVTNDHAEDDEDFDAWS